MILIQYPLTEGQDPNEDLEDAIEKIMNEAGYDMCGSGGVSGEMRDLEFEGESAEHDREFSAAGDIHQQLEDLNRDIEFSVDADEDEE